MSRIDDVRIELESLGIEPEKLFTGSYCVVVNFKNRQDWNLYRLIGKYGNEDWIWIDWFV